MGNRFVVYPPLSALGPDTPSGENLNKIASIPSKIENLQKLKVLGIGCNKLQSLPIELSQLKLLDSLDISFNVNLNIKKEMDILQKLTSLKYLNIIATKWDSTSLEKLQKALPTTEIVTQPFFR